MRGREAHRRPDHKGAQGMDPEAKSDLVVMLAGLAGIVFGHVVRRMLMTPSARARARFTGMAASSVVAAPAIGRVVGDAAGIARERTPAQAALAFLTGATLAFFAEEIGRHVPLLPGRDEAEQR